MPQSSDSCPRCNSTNVRFRPRRSDWICDACDHRWSGEAKPADEDSSGKTKAKLFISYARQDAKELADRLYHDLTRAGYEVWQDTREIRAGGDWQRRIVDGLRSTQLAVAVLSPQAVRVSSDPDNPDNADSVCLDEISFARFAQPPTPVLPVMAIPCEPPFCIFRLDYVNMCAWQVSEEQYQAGLRRLLESTDAALRNKIRYRTWEHDLRPWDFSAFLNERRRDFCGRQWLFEEIDSWRNNSDERALLITGDPGTGKSAIVAQLVHLNPGGHVLAYHCCQADIPDTLRPSRFVRSIAAMIASKLDGYAVQLEDPTVREALYVQRCQEDPATTLEEGVLAPLEKLPAPENSPRYLLIDALDETLQCDASEGLVELLASRIGRFPGWLRVVATTRKERDVLDRLRHLRARELDSQDPRNLQDVDQYVSRRLQTPALSDRLTKSSRSAAVVTRALLEKGAGNFLYVQQALEGIEVDQYRMEDLQELPPGLHSLYEMFFRRRFPDAASYEPARRLLQVMVAACEPLNEHQFATASGLDPDEELPRVLRTLSVYMAKRVEDGDTPTYSAFHKSLADWLTDPQQRGGLYYASPKRGHEQLAAACWQDYQQGIDTMSRYGLAHLPAHLIATQRWADLEQLLHDATYVQATVEAGLAIELASQYAAAVQGMADDARARLLRLPGQWVLQERRLRAAAVLCLVRAASHAPHDVNEVLVELTRANDEAVRQIAVQAASATGNVEVVRVACVHRSKATRGSAGLAGYQIWERDRHRGFALLELLMKRTSLWMLPFRRRNVESAVGITFMILSRHFQEEDVRSRIAELWKTFLGAILKTDRSLTSRVAGPVVRYLVVNAAIEFGVFVLRHWRVKERYETCEEFFRRPAEVRQLMRKHARLLEPEFDISAEVEGLYELGEPNDYLLCKLLSSIVCVHSFHHPQRAQPIVQELVGPAQPLLARNHTLEGWAAQLTANIADRPVAEETLASFASTVRELFETTYANDAVEGSHLIWAPTLIEGHQGKPFSRFMRSLIDRGIESEDPAWLQTCIPATVFAGLSLSAHFTLRTLEPLLEYEDDAFQSALLANLAKLQARFPDETDFYLRQTAVGKRLLHMLNQAPTAEDVGDIMLTGSTNMVAAILCHAPRIRKQLRCIYEKLPDAGGVRGGLRLVAEEALRLLD